MRIKVTHDLKDYLGDNIPNEISRSMTVIVKTINLDPNSTSDMVTMAGHIHKTFLDALIADFNPSRSCFAIANPIIPIMVGNPNRTRR